MTITIPFWIVFLVKWVLTAAIGATLLYVGLRILEFWLRQITVYSAFLQWVWENRKRLWMKPRP